MTTPLSGSITGSSSVSAGQSLPAGERHRGLSYVAETGDGCRIYRQTNGLYAVYAAGGDRPTRTAATLACAYAACQEMAGSAG